MVYKINFSLWNDSLEIGDIVDDVIGNKIKVISIIKIDSYENETDIHVLGVKIEDIE
jgi:hypothetical protein